MKCGLTERSIVIGGRLDRYHCEILEGFAERKNCRIYKKRERRFPMNQVTCVIYLRTLSGVIKTVSTGDHVCL